MNGAGTSGTAWCAVHNVFIGGERVQLVGMFKVRLNHIGSSLILIPRERAILSRYPLVRDLGTCCHICSNYKNH
jgi:hypothetical protein